MDTLTLDPATKFSRNYIYSRETDKFFVYTWINAPEGSKDFLTKLYVKKTEFADGKPVPQFVMRAS